MPSLVFEDGLVSPFSPEATACPPKVVGPTTKKATRPSQDIPQFLIDGARGVTPQAFDPKRHLAYQPPEKIYTMKEIGLEGHGISPNAVSEPFPLFSQEAVKQMRAEFFSEDVLENCQYSSTFIANMIRGMGASRAPFTYAAWRSPEVVGKVSEIAGIDLVPALDFEIANVNISFAGQTQMVYSSNNGECDDEKSAVAWHFDSYPFVCVTMLSDCTDMVGGETALKIGGEVRKVRGPTEGTAVVMQGRYIEHQALKAFGGPERITMVTSFRPKSPFVKDETVLTGVRGISNLSELYSQYTEYRLEVLGERIRAKLKAEHQRQLDRRPFEIDDVRAFLVEQRQWIDSMLEEVIHP